MNFAISAREYDDLGREKGEIVTDRKTTCYGSVCNVQTEYPVDVGQGSFSLLSVFFFAASITASNKAFFC